MSDIVLAADIGGTKTYLALAEPCGSGLRMLHVERYLNDDFRGFDAMLHRFIDEQASNRVIRYAACGAAGPRQGEQIWLTNRPWLIDGAALSATLSGAPVRLLNDFEATAHGVELLEADDLRTLQRGEPVMRAPQVVIGAGTGLGIAYRVWNGERYRMISGEGGHMGFTPGDLRQLELWRSLYERQGRVSAEHVVSGAGLTRIYAFLGGVPDTDPAAVSALALEHEDALALQALDMFAACFGAVAGDHALAVLAYGGVFLAGGIAPKVLQPKQASQLLAAFNSKGGHSELAERIPVHMVVNEQVGLLGAALAAVRGLSAQGPVSHA